MDIMILLLTIALGICIVVFRYRIIRWQAKLWRMRIEHSKVSEKRMNSRIDLPWERRLREGLDVSDYLKTAYEDPQKFQILAGLISVLGLACAVISAAVLLLDIAFRSFPPVK